MSRMLSVGDVYERNYLDSYAYAYAAKLIANNALPEIDARLHQASNPWRPEQVRLAERKAYQLIDQ